MSMGYGQNKDIIVIGGSAAGAAAAARAKRLYPNASVSMIEKSAYVSYGACELPYYLSGEIESLKDLQFYTPEELADEKKIIVLTNSNVLEIDRRKQVLKIESNRQDSTISYDKLIIATGSRPRTILGSFGRYENVFQFKTLSNVENIKKFIEKNHPQKLIILGAGYISLEIIDALKKSGIQITILNIEELPLPGYCDEARKGIKEILFNSGVDYQQISKINDTKNNNVHLKSILCDTAWYDADFYIEAVGVLPNSQLAFESGLKLQNDQTISTDKSMGTSSANIFAAGDVTHGFHLLTGKPYYFPLAQSANMQARTAVANLYNKHESMAGTLGTSGLSFYNMEWVKTGLTFQTAKDLYSNVSFMEFTTRSRPIIMPDSTNIYWHIVFQKNSLKILGATLWGKEKVADRINTLSLAIRNGIPINELAAGDFLYSPRFAPMLDGFHIMGRLINE